MEQFYRIFLLVYIVIYVWVLFVNNIKSFRRKYNIDPRVVMKQDKLMYMFERYRDIIFVVVFINILIYSLVPRVSVALVPITYLDFEVIRGLGVAILIVSMIFTRISQIHLKKAWRIGIDRSETESTLITTGVYRRSRNPIALGMLLGIIGLFLVIPNMTTFTMIIMVHLIFSARIILEEEHLSEQHGEPYEAYRNKTRKWI